MRGNQIQAILFRRPRKNTGRKLSRESSLPAGNLCIYPLCRVLYGKRYFQQLYGCPYTAHPTSQQADFPALQRRKTASNSRRNVLSGKTFLIERICLPSHVRISRGSLKQNRRDSHLFRQEILQFYCQIKKKEKDMKKWP